MKKENRIDYFDGLKALCIILVIISHCSSYIPKNSIFGNLLDMSPWAAVPCFMMITGGLLNKNEVFSWKKYFNRLFKTYFVLCIWKAIYLLIYYINGGIYYGVIASVQFIFLFLDVDGVIYGHTWYIVAYLVVLLVYPVIHFLFHVKDINNNYSGRKILVFIAGICLFDGIIVHTTDWWLEYLLKALGIHKLPLAGIEKILPFINYSNMIFYFIVGLFLYEYRETIYKRIYKYKNLLILVIIGCILILALTKYIETGLIIWGGQHASIGYNRIITVFYSISLYLIFYLNKEKFNVFNKTIGKIIGRNTLGIFYIHEIILYILRNIYKNYINNTNLAFMLLAVFITLIFSLLITIIMKKIPIIKNLVN